MRNHNSIIFGFIALVCLVLTLVLTNLDMVLTTNSRAATPMVKPTLPRSTSPITVFAPNGGEVLSPNQHYTITWSSPTVDQIAIDLVDADGKFSTIALPMSGQITSFDWLIPPTWYSTSRQFKIKVYQYPPTGLSDFSDNFFSISFPAPPTITPSPTRIPTRIPTPTPYQMLRVVAPNDTTSLVANTPYQIQWLDTNVPTVSTIRLIYFDNAGVYVGMHLIASNIPTANQYNWTVSNYGNGLGIATKYKIEIASQWTSDLSDNYFTISAQPPTPTPTPASWCDGVDGSACETTSCPVCTTPKCPMSKCTITKGICYSHYCKSVKPSPTPVLTRK